MIAWRHQELGVRPEPAQPGRARVCADMTGGSTLAAMRRARVRSSGRLREGGVWCGEEIGIDEAIALDDLSGCY